MATIQYTTYRFNRPSMLIQSDYETLKELLSESPNYNLNPPNNFIDAFRGELIFLTVGAVSLLLLSLDIAEWLNWVGGISFFIAFFSLFSFVPSLFSYLGFLSAKARYYSSLRRDIVKSKDYNDFVNFRKKRQ